MWNGDWTKIPMGMPGLETLLPLTYTAGVLEAPHARRDVHEAQHEPGEDHGPLSAQGAIQVGADADIAIIHPRSTLAVDPNSMETNADWSPYEGWELPASRARRSRGAR